MKILSQFLLVIASALLIAAVSFGILSFKEVGPPVPLEVAPPILQADALIAALTAPKDMHDEHAQAVKPTVPIPTPQLEEIPDLVAKRFGRFVEEASDNTDRIDVDAAANYLRKRSEGIADAQYRQVFFEGLLRTSHEVLANDAVFAAAQRASAATVMNQFYDAYEGQFYAGLTQEAERLDALREQREERETQATRYRVIAVLCFVPSLFFGSVWLIARSRIQKTMKGRFTSAQRALRSGDLAPMQRLSKESLGDAWFALARSYASGSQVERNDEAATSAYGEAMNSRVWIDDMKNVCATEYYNRLFFGIGAKPDYSALLKEWKDHHFSGYGHEIELAWILACGPEELRDHTEAWSWLAIHEARWGSSEPPALPSGTFEELRQLIMRKVPDAARRKSEDAAKAQAHREFVEGK